MSDELLWMDLETTGLVPREGRILEVACIATDKDLNVLSTYHTLIGPPPTDVEIREWPQVVWDMHRDSGLISELKQLVEIDRGFVPGVARVEQAIIRWLNGLELVKPIVLAGSSVDFDRNWLEVHMPDLWSNLHYRVADVSSTREFIRRWMPFYDEALMAVLGERAPSKHRAMPDLEDSLALARVFQGWFRF